MRRVKRFKDYERLFSNVVGIARLEDQKELEQAAIIQSWLHRDQYRQWSQEEVLHAVYKAPDHEAWQKLRISLKGLPTRHKLFRLEQIWRLSIAEPSTQAELFHCRIDNYLSALIRGGQLNRKLEVLK